MSRELKFRAWDSERNTYDHEELLLAPNGDILASRWQELCEPESEYIIEQYTGLKDKNGKEIYEGDIVMLSGRVAKNKSTIYKVVWDSFLTGFDLISLEPNKSDVGYLNETETENRYEVIGNIHDNPELLEEK